MKQKNIHEERIKAYKKWRKKWPKIELADITKVTPSIKLLLDYIEENYAVPAIYKQYKIGKKDWVDPDNIKIEKFHLYLHCYDLLMHKDIADGELKPDLLNVVGLDDPWGIAKLMGLENLNHFQFVAELASAIHSGGAYDGSICDAKGEKALELALACYKEWAVNHEFNTWELSFNRLGNEWSSWFCNVAWDNAWVSYDYKAGVFTLFAITDTD